LPRLVIRRRPPSLFDYVYDDFEISGYRHHDAIRLAVRYALAVVLDDACAGSDVPCREHAGAVNPRAADTVRQSADATRHAGTRQTATGARIASWWR
jgi:hypothetical protein